MAKLIVALLLLISTVIVRALPTRNFDDADVAAAIHRQYDPPGDDVDDEPFNGPMRKMPKIPCGLPAAVDQLSAAEQGDLHAIWDGYVDGADCTSEQVATMAWLNAQTDPEILQTLYPNATLINGGDSDEEGGRRGHGGRGHGGRGHHGGGGGRGRHGHHHGHRRPHPPPFLRNATRAVQRQFMRIYKNMTMSRDEQQQAADALIANQTADIQAAYETFKERMAAMKANMTAMIEKKVANLSSDAQTAYRQLKTIWENGSLSMIGAKKEIMKYWLSLSDSVQQELMSLVPRRPRDDEDDDEDDYDSDYMMVFDVPVPMTSYDYVYVLLIPAGDYSDYQMTSDDDGGDDGDTDGHRPVLSNYPSYEDDD